MTIRVSSPILIARTQELERLMETYRSVSSGRSTTALVAGDAGIGKTRLLGAFVEQVEEEGALVLRGSCLALSEASFPFAPIAEALRGLLRRLTNAELDAAFGGGRAELARLVPDLGTPDAPDADRTGVGTDSAQGRLFEHVLGVLERLARSRPVVFVVEDLHWSDRSTRDLLRFLVQNLHDVAVMLVLTYRTDELHRRHPLLPFIAELVRAGTVERLELRPFDRQEAAAQLRAIAGHELEFDLVESIHARSGGNAFFAEELLIAADQNDPLDLPPTLRDVLLARVAELAEPAQAFLRIASAAGQRVDPQLVAASADLDQPTLYEALRECVARHVLVPDDDGGVERYAFRHALLQEAVYEELLPGERTRLHATFARALEANGPADPSHAAELAYHWYAAHNLPRALSASMAAGAAAEARYAFAEAAAHYERVIELWDEVPDAAVLAGQDRVEVLAALARVEAFHDPARALAHIQAAIALVDAARDPIRAGLLRERLGRYAWTAGQGSLAKRAYEEAMILIPASPPSEARARATAGRAQTLFLGGRFVESLPLAEEALQLAQAVGSRAIEGHALNTRGADRALAGDIDGAVEDLQAALGIAEEVGNADDVIRAYVNWAWALQLGGRVEDSIRLSQVGVETCERMGLLRLYGTHILCTEADMLFRLGRWDEVEEDLGRSQEIGPLGNSEILCEELLGRLAMARGRLDEAARRLLPLASRAERAVDIQFVAPVEASLAELALLQDRPEAARTAVETALRLLEGSTEIRIGELFALGLRANADIAEIARARHAADQERVAVLAGERMLETMRQRHVEAVAVRSSLGELSAGWLRHCEAEASRLAGHADPEAWAAVADAWLRLPYPYAAAYARWREGEAVLMARGDRGAAGIALRRSLELARRLGAVPLVKQVELLAGRGRLSLEDAAEPVSTSEQDVLAGFGLTAREREVLVLVALGRTNRQIADQLFISENTAGVHVSNILGKLGVSGRGEAAAVAHRLGVTAESRFDPGARTSRVTPPGG